MKKILKIEWLRFAMIVAVVTTAFAGTARANDVLYKTMDFSQCTFSGPDNKGNKTVSATYGGFKVSLTNCKNTGNNSGNSYFDYVECKSGSEITTAIAIDKPVAKIDVTMRSDATITVKTSADYISWTTVTLTGSDYENGVKSLTFTNTTGHLYYKLIFGGDATVDQVEYYRFFDDSIVQDPEITGPAKFDTEASITITCETDGATIQYSEDGGVNWKYYQGPFTINATTTVTAKASKQGKTPSAEVSRSFCKASDVITATWNLTLVPTGQNTQDKAIWNKDANGKATDAVMSLLKGTSSSAQVSPSSSGTEFQTGQIWQFVPLEGYRIISIKITASSSRDMEGYASGWTNATFPAEYEGLTEVILEPQVGTDPVSVEIDRSGKQTKGARVLAVEVDCAKTTSPFIALEEEINLSSEAVNNGLIEVVYNEIPSDATVTVIPCNQSGAEATYDWLTLTLTGGNISYTTTANTASPRTAYLKVIATFTEDEETKTVESPVVTVIQEGEVETVGVSVGSYGYATFCSDKVLDFTNTGIEVSYLTLDADGTTLIYNPITIVPANTGIVLHKDGGTDGYVFVPVTTEEPDDATGNLLVRGQGVDVPISYSATERNYILYANATHPIGFYRANKSKIAEDRAYLVLPQGTPEVKSFVFGEDNATGIQTIENAVEDGVIYNIAGQRMSKMQKGINIVNGKKILK